MKTHDCRALGSHIAGIWARWFIFRAACPCTECDVIIATQINLDIARRIAAREMVLS
jgi:hypothetical protein